MAFELIERASRARQKGGVSVAVNTEGYVRVVFGHETGIKDQDLLSVALGTGCDEGWIRFAVVAERDGYTLKARTRSAELSPAVMAKFSALRLPPSKVSAIDVAWRREDDGAITVDFRHLRGQSDD